MSKKHIKQTEKQLIEIINSRNNANKCGECGSDYPTWASWNLGILLCGRCASLHKKVLNVDGPRGGPISKVKSLTLETWSDDQLEALRRIGNRKAKQRWNPKRIPFPQDDDDTSAIEEYLRDKYINCRFRDDTDDFHNGDDKFSRYSNESGALTPAGRRSRLSTVNSVGRLRAGSRQVPRLLHRELTTYEQTQFQSQVHKITMFGYSDRDAVLESLILSSGDIDFALDILDYDSKINPSQTELPPDLPKRPSMSAPASTQAATTAAQVSPDWWTGATSQQQQPLAAQTQPVTPVGQPQIYQYTDPVTGQISYIDSNGQQYLDPNNAQHQQILMQQTNPQLYAQQTNKQNILSLYNQPDNFTTNVAVATGQNTQGQTQQPQGFQPQNTQSAQAQLQQQTGLYGQAGQQPQGQNVGQYGQQLYMQPTAQQQNGYYGQPQQFTTGQPQQFTGQPQQFTSGQPQQQYWR